MVGQFIKVLDIVLIALLSIKNTGTDGVLLFSSVHFVLIQNEPENQNDL